MLVARQYETDQGRWSSKFDPLLNRSNSLRMSNYDGSSSLQSGWNGHASVVPNTDNSLYPHSAGQATRGSIDDATTSRLQTTNASGALPEIRLEEPASMIGTTASDYQPTSTPELSQSQAEPRGHARSTRNLHGLVVKAETASDFTGKSSSSMTPNALPRPGPSGSQGIHSSSPTAPFDHEGMLRTKDEDDLGDEDDDMLDVEGEISGRPMTAAERTAARRKMKRFRLTHQQTRFLMSEFAKQPHPDAAHRERLSREIPGLSPRQVQVWFQNRRAKIKRLTADDRDRMIKMRAVPDDFDNVQALHSPYGAVHALGTPMASPSGYVGSPYGDHNMMRPLMGDPSRRVEGDSALSQTPMHSSYGGIGGFPSATPVPSSDLPSPLSTSPNERNYFSHQMTSPLSASQRSSHPYGRNDGVDTENHLQTSPQLMRPLQPLHLRETLSRARSESIQSPLRSSMSWKGDSIDYNAFPIGSGSPSGPSRHQPLYQAEHYDTGSYISSSTNINYSSVPPPSLQQPQRSRSTRLRAATASLPLGLDLRNQYRPMVTTQGLQPPHSAVVQRHNPPTPYGISSSFPSAPLTAPVDYTQPRTPGVRPPGIDSYSYPQMSAPIAAPADFGHAMQSGNSIAATSRTPMRDSFGYLNHMGSGSDPVGRLEDPAKSQA
ncbi:hypothetical protein Micbo1qcDRAFT_50819 [Microdochium bolleyi]|uniref:Homeobox domain-containing protein n=1 Tax=Microdochium bolleyi TaxID=196109 RepID=A0A136J6F9_9PEZI|nr:hypothetical protein Micbo1qcDRAFT_50819 [Microdochium bolleyi]